MNLWQRIEARNAGDDAEGAEHAKARGADRTPRVPRLDLALEISAFVARVVLDARLSFAVAVIVAAFVPGIRGQLITAILVALGATLLYRADRLQRIPEHLRWLAWADLNRPLLRRLSLEAPGTYAHTIATASPNQHGKWLWCLSALGPNKAVTTAATSGATGINHKTIC